MAMHFVFETWIKSTFCHWAFYTISKLMHGCLEKWNFSSQVKLISHIKLKRKIPYLCVLMYYSLCKLYLLSISSERYPVSFFEIFFYFKFLYQVSWHGLFSQQLDQLTREVKLIDEDMKRVKEMIATHNRQYPLPVPLTLPGAERLLVNDVVMISDIVWFILHSANLVPKTSGLLVSRWAAGETLGWWN